MVNAVQAMRAHRRVSMWRPSLTRPVISDAMAKAKGTVKPTMPKYSNGG